MAWILSGVLALLAAAMVPTAYPALAERLEICLDPPNALVIAVALVALAFAFAGIDG